MFAATLKDDLLGRMTPGPERGGVILHDGTIVEFENKADDPEQGFLPDISELIPHVEQLSATWHTHPGETANLSVEDSETFTDWPALYHVIVGTDGLRIYVVRHGAVVNYA